MSILESDTNLKPSLQRQEKRRSGGGLVESGGWQEESDTNLKPSLQLQGNRRSEGLGESGGWQEESDKPEAKSTTTRKRRSGGLVESRGLGMVMVIQNRESRMEVQRHCNSPNQIPS